MNNEYIIVNKTALEKRIEELEKEIDDKKIDVEVQRLIKHELKQILSNSAPIIPEIEKAMNAAREIQDDSAHDTFTAEDISGCTEVCTHGWRYKTTNKDYISNLKLDI